MMEAAKLRTIGHFKFAYVKFDVLHMNLDETEKCVKIRWRITGISAFKVIFQLSIIGQKVYIYMYMPKKDVTWSKNTWCEK